MILHGPAEVNGYEQGGNRFALYCIFNAKIAETMKWYLNNERIFIGSPTYSRIVSKPGIYKVTVAGKNGANSESVYAEVKSDESNFCLITLYYSHFLSFFYIDGFLKAYPVNASKVGFSGYPSADMVSVCSAKS
jgi:hypothetical protein